MSLFATDSRFTSPLWVLNILATAPTSGSLNLDVSFSSNPLLGLDDMAITKQVKEDLQKSNGTLSDYSLFDTTYDVSVPTDYGEGLEAMVGNAVPEPSTLALAASGGLLGLGVWWRRRRHQCD